MMSALSTFMFFLILWLTSRSGDFVVLFELMVSSLLEQSFGIKCNIKGTPDSRVKSSHADNLFKTSIGLLVDFKMNLKGEK